MNVFNSTYQASGITATVRAANTLSDQYLADVATTPELVIHLTGFISLVWYRLFWVYRYINTVKEGL